MNTTIDLMDINNMIKELSILDTYTYTTIYPIINKNNRKIIVLIFILILLILIYLIIN